MTSPGTTTPGTDVVRDIVLGLGIELPVGVLNGIL